MSYRKEIGVIALVAFGFISVAYYIGPNLEMLGLCRTDVSVLNPLRCDNMEEMIVEPIGLAFVSLFLSLAPLFFLKEAVYRAWKKFTIIYIPIATFIFAFGTVSSSGGFGPSMALTKEIASVWLSALFIIISVGIMIVKTWKLRGSDSHGENVPVRKKDDSEL